jgi:hypothetical protein
MTTLKIQATPSLGTLLVVALLASASTVHAGVNSTARLRALAKMQDWSGMWEVDGSPGTLEPQPVGSGGPPGASAPPGFGAAPAMRDHPPYNAEWEAKYRALFEGDPEIRAGKNTNHKYCAAGMPRILASPFMFEVTITPQKTWFYYTQREMRHIYTDGRPHTPEEDVWPTLWGDSIGHWEGAALLIDTTDIIPELFLDPSGATLSGAAHVKERWTMPSKDSLQNEISIDDAVAFRKGTVWKFTRNYKRVTNFNRMIDDICGENERQFLGDDGKLKTIL